MSESIETDYCLRKWFNSNKKETISFNFVETQDSDELTISIYKTPEDEEKSIYVLSLFVYDGIKKVKSFPNAIIMTADDLINPKYEHDFVVLESVHISISNIVRGKLLLSIHKGKPWDKDTKKHIDILVDLINKQAKFKPINGEDKCQKSYSH